MKRIISLLLATVLACGCVLTLAACTADETEINDGAQICIYLGDEVYDLDPSDSFFNDNAAQFMSLLYEPLFSIGKLGALKKAAAKSYKINRRDREIVITLRESYWSDGNRVTAQDFIFAWRDRICAPENANPAAALFYGIENAIEVKTGTCELYDFGVDATGLYELTIHYIEGVKPRDILRNLASLATAPVRENVVESAASYWSKSTNSIATNGPFTVTSYDVVDGSFVLERNVGYHQPLDRKNKTRIVPIQSMATFWDGTIPVELSYDAISSKAIFFLGEAPLSERSTYEKKAKTADTLTTYSYLFNSANPLFANADVRRALSLALDREEMADTAVFGSPATAYHPSSKLKLISKNANMSEAEELLLNVNFTGLSKSFRLTVSDDEESVALAELAKTAWEKLGFTVEIVKVSATKSVVMDRMTDSELEIYDSTIQYLLKDAALGKTTDDAGKPTFDIIAFDAQMYSEDKFVGLCMYDSKLNGNGRSYAQTANRAPLFGFTDAEKAEAYNNKLMSALTASNKSARNALLDEAETMLVDEAVVIPVMFRQNFAFISGKLSGVKIDGFGNFVFTKANANKKLAMIPDREGRAALKEEAKARKAQSES